MSFFHLKKLNIESLIHRRLISIMKQKTKYDRLIRWATQWHSIVLCFVIIVNVRNIIFLFSFTIVIYASLRLSVRFQKFCVSNTCFFFLARWRWNHPGLFHFFLHFFFHVHMVSCTWCNKEDNFLIPMWHCEPDPFLCLFFFSFF